MFRRTIIPNLEFNTASSTQVESFSVPIQEPSIHICYELEEVTSLNPETGMGQSSDGEIVQIVFSSAPAKSQSFNLIYKF